MQQQGVQVVAPVSTAQPFNPAPPPPPQYTADGGGPPTHGGEMQIWLLLLF